jgi:hypothetical protein
VAEVAADGAGRAVFDSLDTGTYVVSQTAGGQRSLLSSPVTLPLVPIDIEPFCEASGTGASPFDDITGTTFEAEIRCLAAAAVTNGVTARTYAPGLDVSREQMATFIANLIDAAADLATGDDAVRALPAHDGTNRFSDVGASSVHLAAINRLARAGIVTGGPGGAPADQFGPGIPVSRAQMASLVSRALSYVLEETLTSDADHFTDDDDVVHQQSIDVAADHGIAVGVGPERFDPHGAIRRGQMAGFLARTLAVLEDRGLVAPLPR